MQATRGLRRARRASAHRQPRDAVGVAQEVFRLSPTDASQLLICRRCDSVYQPVLLRPGESARCAACGELLATGARHDVERLLALTAAAAVLFTIVSVTPVLSVTLAGTHTQVNIWRAAVALAHGWISIAALTLALVTFLIPLLQILLLLWILAYARAGARAPADRWALRTLQALRPWSMTEVFMLGALVAIVKLSVWFPVTLGPGIWALGGLTVILAILDLREAHGAWRLFGQLPA